MKRAVSAIAVVLTLLTAAGVSAAGAPGPSALSRGVRPLAEVPLLTLPAVDTAAAIAEDPRREAAGLAPRFAIPVAVSVTPATHGLWEDAGSGSLLWRLRVASTGALSLNFGFTRFFLPPEARLTVSSADGRDVIRPFTSADNAPHGQLWTPVVRGEQAVLEVSIPAGLREKLVLELTSVGHDYRGFGRLALGPSAPESGACNVDVVCPEGAPWADEIRAVAVISTGGSTFCSGSMINNARNDLTPYFITANHCSITAGNAASLVTYWNFQNSTCRPVGSPASGGAGNGTLTQFMTGSTFRAAYAPSDFTLVQMTGVPPPAFNIRWEGWDRSTGDSACSVATPCATIHHPNTDEKRITFSTTPTTTTSYNLPPVPGDGTHTHAVWSLGVTEPGSSGSPLFNEAHRYVGQLHGGPSVCGGADLSDYYGRFSVSWTGGGTAATRLRDWLDPDNTGVVAIDGINQCTTPGAPVIGTATASAANQVTLTFTAGAPAGATYRISRAIGTCAAPGAFTQIASGVAASPYIDNTVSGGTTYAYHVAAADTTGVCVSADSSCAEATATGACTLAPTFTGLTSVGNNASASCQLNLAWNAASANCGGPVTYNVYRSTTSGFVPALANRIAAGLTGTSYNDASPLTNGVAYYYVVRAVDGTNSSEDANTAQQSGVPTGPIVSGTLTDTFEGALSGGGFDNAGWTHAALSGANDWTWSTAQSQTPTHSWFSSEMSSIAHRTLVSPTFVVQAGATLSFWHTYAFEGSVANCYDAGTLEYSSDGGSTWTVVPDAAFTAGGFTGTVNGGFSNPLAGKRAWCSGTIGAMTQVTVDLAAIPSLVGQPNVQVRWHEGDDSSVTATGWYVDSVTITNVGTAGTCNTTPVDLLAFEAD